ncbi:matrix metallopeptidase 16 [Phyllostomus discolor]|uniref:Matrix metallopeptidase 16 n=1 Tax=Phyllostomus discolor TaxID=89673 RepID=A0A834E192_9CHIR|nr:matrix metallopeptidase 16 [Phyllostomus discolor]
MILLALGSGRRLDFVHHPGAIFLQTLLWILCAAVCGTEPYFNVELSFSWSGMRPNLQIFQSYLGKVSVQTGLRTSESSLSWSEMAVGGNAWGHLGTLVCHVLHDFITAPGMAMKLLRTCLGQCGERDQLVYPEATPCHGHGLASLRDGSRGSSCPGFPTFS